MTTAPPSDGPMSLLFDVWLVGGLTAGLLDQVLGDTELNGDDFGMYSLLDRFGPATPTQIHRWTGLRPTTVSTHLKRIEARGHVTRTPHPGDRRSHTLGLSAEGKQALDRATEPFLAAMHDLRAKFVPDTVRERLVLQHVDALLRDSTGLDERPYRVTSGSDDPVGPPGVPVLAYSGEPLSPTQEEQVRLYIDFLRSQDPNPGRTRRRATPAPKDPS
jgi:DNA-binding MarR family transcriptional regulator